MKIFEVLDRKVLLIPDRECGGYTVEVPSLPGCITEGASIAKALANAAEVIPFFIDSLVADGEDVPGELSEKEIDCYIQGLIESGQIVSADVPV